MTSETYANGKIVERWDDTTRIYTDFRTTPATTRPYTAAENTVADADAARASAIATHEGTMTRIKAIITDLQAEKDRVQPAIDATNATINANPAGYIKDNARAAKRIADAAIDLARYIDGK